MAAPPCAQVRLRLGHETTARCAAPDWTTLHLGCYASSTFVDSYAGQEGASRRFDGGLSLERCALHCQTSAALAAAFAVAGDECLCLSSAGTPSLRAALPNSACNATCSADDSQLCGSPSVTISHLAPPPPSSPPSPPSAPPQPSLPPQPPSPAQPPADPSSLMSHADAPYMASQLVESSLLVVPQLGSRPSAGANKGGRGLWRCRQYPPAPEL